MANSAKYNHFYRDLDVIGPADQLSREEITATHARAERMRANRIVGLELAEVERLFLSIPGVAEAVARKDRAAINHAVAEALRARP